MLIESVFSVICIAAAIILARLESVTPPHQAIVLTILALFPLAAYLNTRKYIGDARSALDQLAPAK
jgi:hypothetical protein